MVVILGSCDQPENQNQPEMGLWPWNLFFFVMPSQPWRLYPVAETNLKINRKWACDHGT